MTTEEHLKQLTAAIIRLDARCDGLALVLMSLAGHVGADPEKIWKAVEDASAQRHQEMLEALEGSDPGLAASLDFRAKPPPSLFD